MRYIYRILIFGHSSIAGFFLPPTTFIKYQVRPDGEYAFNEINTPLANFSITFMTRKIIARLTGNMIYIQYAQYPVFVMLIFLHLER